MYTNARGLRSKIASLEAATLIYKPDVILIAESHIRGKTTISIKGYNEKGLRNRKNNGGGLLIAKRNDSNINLLTLEIHEEHEHLWVKINNIVIALVYGYIESRTDMTTIEDWYFELEKSYSKVQDQNVMIIGDMNAHIGNDLQGIEGNDSKINKSGEILRSFTDRRDLIIINNDNKCTGKWTREDPNGGKSILDLVISNNHLMNLIKKVNIDEEHKLKLLRKKKKGPKYIDVKSDHNTITIEISIQKETSYNQKYKLWNIKNENSWVKYHDETSKMFMKVRWEDNKDMNIKYKIWSRQIKSLMYKHLTRITLKGGKIINSKIKTITKRRKAVANEILKLKRKGILQGVVVDYLIKQQEKLRDETISEIQKEKTESLNRRMKKLITKNSISNEIWKIRKRSYGKAEAKLAIKTKEGNLITNIPEIQSRYKEYYGELLQNRKNKPEYQIYEEHIEQNFKLFSQVKCYDEDPINQKFTRKELDLTIKSLQKEKSTGPDEIYNEMLIHAGENLRNNLLDMINFFSEKEQIPEELYEIYIKSIYKGKGDSGNLENQRGIFLSSTILKIKEKMILNRAEPIIETGMSRYQAGGRKNYSIKDQVFIVRSIISKHKYFKQNLIMEFIDLRKAFDKMVLKNVMQNLWEIGVKGRIWRIIYCINKKATIKIKSSLGTTDEFIIGDILKQGSVLAANLAALHTDTVCKRFENTGLGVGYGEEIIPLLLYQDDIVKFDNKIENMQKSNIILEVFQNENRMEYHPSKSVLMTNIKNQEPIKLNNINVPVVEEYKYLGDFINMDNNLMNMINDRKNTINGTVAEIISITSETRQFSIIAAIQYMNGIITPKLLLNAETWHPISQQEINLLEQVYSQSLKRLLHLPFSTPTKGLYNELGIQSVKYQILTKKLMYAHKIWNKSEQTLIKSIIKEQMGIPGDTWVKCIIEELETMKEKPKINQLQKYTKPQWKKIVQQHAKEKEQIEFRNWAQESKKCHHMQNSPIETKQYIYEFNPRTAKIVLEIRLGLIDVKRNFQNKHEDSLCRNCINEEETTEHFIKCLSNEETLSKLQSYDQIYKMNDLKNLKETAELIYEIIANNKFFTYKEI